MVWKHGKGIDAQWTVRKNGQSVTPAPISDPTFPLGSLSAYLGAEGINSQLTPTVRNGGSFDIFELKIYPRELTETETISAEQTMAASYGTSASCTLAQPCGNGVGTCTVNTCAQGLVCGYGMGPRFGLASGDVCWDPHVGGTVGGVDAVIPSPDEYPHWDMIAVGDRQGCGIQQGALYCWGDVVSGGLGIGPGVAVAQRPTRVGNASDWSFVASGANHVCGIRSGELYCWGDNNSWQLGGTSGNQGSPIRVGTDSDWQLVTADETHTCGIRHGGELYCWGSNGHGEIGDGTLTSRSQPTRVGTSSDWTSVSAGRNKTCGIRSGELWCWGHNGGGELGLGHRDTPQLLPVRSGSASDWAQVSSSENWSCGIRSGALYCSNFDTASVFVRIGTLSNWQDVALGGYGYGCGIESGALYCWDWNALNAPSSNPALLGTLTGWTDVDNEFGFYGATCGLRSGLRYCWSHNGKYNYGDGTTVESSTPVFTDQPLDNSILVHLTPDTIGANASTWRDARGSGTTFAAAAGSAAPTLVTGAGGKPAVRFSGAQYMHASLGDTSAWQGITIAAVVTTPSPLTVDGTVLSSGGSANFADPTTSVRWAAAVGTDATRGLGWYDDIAAHGLGDGSLAPSMTYVMVWKRGNGPSAAWSVRKNGLPVNTTPIPDVSFPTGHFSAYLGAEGVATSTVRAGGNADISEVIVYNRELTTSESIALEHTLATQYGVTDGCAAATCTELCPCDVGGICTSDLHCMADLSCKKGVAARFNQPPGVKVCWNENCDDLRSPLFDCGRPDALCGPSCPSCTPQCNGKNCGSDGCWSECGVECVAGEQGCTSHDDCAAGLDCIASSTGNNVCLPGRCDSPGLNPCSDPANAGQQTVCGQCPSCTPDCGSRECGPAPNGCGECGQQSLGPTEYCTAEGHRAPLTTFLSGALASDPAIAPQLEGLADGEATPGTLPGGLTVSDSGQATYTIPLQVPPGRNGIEPRLALAYNSGAGNGYLGMGWGLTGLSVITRCPKTIAQDGETSGITYTAEDRFCLDGNRLVPVNTNVPYGEAVEYRTEMETFSRIRAHDEGAFGEPGSFQVWTKDGRILTYDFRVGGNTPLSDKGVRVPNFSETDSTQLHTQSWLLTTVEDRFGNAMRISYASPGSWIGHAADPGIHTTNAIYGLGQKNTWSTMGGVVREYFPSHIDYTSHVGVEPDRRIEFSYHKRSDVLEGYQYGVRYERTQLLDTITTYVQGQRIFQYKLAYTEPEADAETGEVESEHLHERSLLHSVQQCARAAVIDPNTTTCKPPTVFEYQEVVPYYPFPPEQGPSIGDVADADADFVGRPLVLDIDGNGQDDFMYSVCSHVSQGICDKLEWQLFLNGASKPFNAERLVSQGPGVIAPARTFVVDYDLDGRDDVLEIDVAYRAANGGRIRRWQYDAGNDQPVSSSLDVDLGSPVDGGNVYLLDANGDGASDLLVCTPQYAGPTHNTPRKVASNTWTLFVHDGTHGFGAAVTLTTLGPGCQEANVMDLNGDGKQELLLNTTPLGKTAYSIHNAPYFVQNDASAVFWPDTGETTDTVLPAVARDSLRLVLDMNGDGLADVIELDDTFHVTAWINTGSGFVSRESELDLAAAGGGTHYSGHDFLRQVARFAVAIDENLDGRTDLLVKSVDDNWALLRSVGTEFEVRLLGWGAHGANHMFVYDDDHDGTADVAWNGFIARRARSSMPRLFAVTDGLGARTEVDYEDLGHGADELDGLPQGPVYTHSTAGCGYPIYCRHPRGAVVREQRQWDVPWNFGDPSAPPRRLFYGYANSAFQLHGRGSLGFGARTITDKARNDIAAQHGGTHLIVLSYNNKLVADTQNEFLPYVGIVAARDEISTAASGRTHLSLLIRDLRTSYPSPLSFFPHTESEINLVAESAGALSANDVIGQVVQSWEYDDYGNVTQFESQWADNYDGKPVDQTIVTTAYVIDQDANNEHLSRWLISQPRLQYENGSNANGTVPPRSTIFQYGEDNASSAPGSYPYSGRPETVITDVANTLTTRYRYNDFGNVEAITATGATVDGSRTRAITREFDESQMYPLRTTEFPSDAAGHTVEVIAYDHGLGIVEGTSEEGLADAPPVRRLSLKDGFGRVRRIVDADGSTTDVSYQQEMDLLDRNGYSVSTDRAGYPSLHVFYDVLGREYRRVTDGFDNPLTVDTRYNDLGLVSAFSRPHTAAVAGDADLDFTQQSYDSMGRPVLTTLPDGNTIQRCYFDNVTCTRNPRGYTSCVVFNEHGQLAHSVQPQDDASLDCDEVAADVAQNFPAEGDALGAAGLRASRYRYDAFGALGVIEDPAHNTITFQRDAYGRVLAQDDPDSGLWHRTYNAFGELETETDPDGQQAVLRYDGLGRPVSRTDRAATPSGTDQTTLWQWDSDPLNPGGFYGKLLATITGSVAERMIYDDAGRLITEARVIAGEDQVDQILTRHQEYDPATGRLSLLTFESANDPDAAMRIRHNYNERGYLSSLNWITQGVDRQVWRAVSTDSYGQLTQERFGNGVLTDRTYWADTGQLDQLKTSYGGEELQNWRHFYDENGGLIGRLPANSPLAYTYAYDALDRLESVGLTSGSESAEIERYEYDVLGNISRKSTGIGEASESWTYDYDDGTGRPHAVKSISNDAAVQEYHYDASGNLTTRSAGMQSGLAIGYNRQQLPSRIGSTLTSADAITLAYTAGRERARKAGPSGETFYLDDYYSRSRASGASGFVEKLVVSADGHAVAEIARDASGHDTLTYLHADRLGSVEVVTDEDGTVLERRDYEAFGQRREVTGPGAPYGVRGDFTGHELDGEFGLINMKARLYDPAIGRFIMPDPILDRPWHSEGPNPYRYVFNDPVNAVDPFGLSSCDDWVQATGHPCPEQGGDDAGGGTPPWVSVSAVIGGGIVLGGLIGSIATGSTVVEAAAPPVAAGVAEGGAAAGAGAAAFIPVAGAVIAGVTFVALAIVATSGPPTPPARNGATVMDARTETGTSVAPHASSVSTEGASATATVYPPGITNMASFAKHYADPVALVDPARLTAGAEPSWIEASILSPFETISDWADPDVSVTQKVIGTVVLAASFLPVGAATGSASEMGEAALSGTGHALERHVGYDIAKYAGKSKFNIGVGESVEDLIKLGARQPAVAQPNGYLLRTFDVGREIGFDRAIGRQTSIMTIVSKADGTVVTAFPGSP
jgi:RHS repeat-associated protein